MDPTFVAKNFVANAVRDIPRSGIRDFFDLVQGVPGVISLGVGEPDFVTPWHIREAAIYALEKGRTSYTANLGLLKLREAIAKHLAEKFHVTYNPKNEVLIAVGVSEAMDIAFRAIINPGDEIIYHEPCYVSYAPGIAMTGGVPVRVSCKAANGFAVTAAEIEKVITPKSKALVLNFPTLRLAVGVPRQRIGCDVADGEDAELHELLPLARQLFA
jgi:aminotransferase